MAKPETYEQPCQDPKWIEAMKAEIAALVANKTWDIVSLPLGHRPIECKWMYKIKYNSNGIVDGTMPVLLPKDSLNMMGLTIHKLLLWLPNSLLSGASLSYASVCG